MQAMFQGLQDFVAKLMKNEEGLQDCSRSIQDNVGNINVSARSLQECGRSVRHCVRCRLDWVCNLYDCVRSLEKLGHVIEVLGEGLEP